jgi:hypothetical protein
MNISERHNMLAQTGGANTHKKCQKEFIIPRREEKRDFLHLPLSLFWRTSSHHIHPNSHPKFMAPHIHYIVHTHRRRLFIARAFVYGARRGVQREILIWPVFGSPRVLAEKLSAFPMCPCSRARVEYN